MSAARIRPLVAWGLRGAAGLCTGAVFLDDRCRQFLLGPPSPPRCDGGGMRQQALDELAERYEVHKQVGRGHFACVRVGQSLATGDDVAIKLIPRSRKTEEVVREHFRLEVDAMNRVFWHPHIVNLVEAFETPRYFVIVMDHASGGELFNRIVSKGQYSEADASDLIRGVMSAVNHCHRRGVCHRDLKPENILLSSRESDVDVRLCDFGVAKTMPPVSGCRPETPCLTGHGGTVSYSAPEQLRAKPEAYSAKVDEFAVGCILYILLGGYHPFDPTCSASDATIRRRIVKGEWDFSGEAWGHVSDSAKGLVRSLLATDPAKRLSAREALEHPWVQGKSAPTQPLRKSAARLAEFNKARNAWRRAALDPLWADGGHGADEVPQRADLEAAFRRIDENGDGSISYEELGHYLRRFQTGDPVTAKDLDEMFRTADVLHNGKITMEEFMAMVI